MEERPTTPTIHTAGLVPRFPQLSDSDDPDGGGSPRTQVAGRFQRLDLDPEHAGGFDTPSRESKRIAWSRESANFQDEGCPIQISQHMSTEPSNSGTGESLSASSSTSDHRKLLNPNNQQHGRSKSPSLTGEISDQYWHESEITGHNPDDPNDDGYGINGIGFKPTPAIAWARSQKRKQQLADYRTREAREARQRRSERRRIGSTEVKLDDSMFESERRGKVRFDSG